MPSRDAVLPPPHERWYEDYEQGRSYDLGTFKATEKEMITFARAYDPQPMHTDVSHPGGVIASGWYTMCLTMRQIAEHYLSTVAGLPSPGVDAIKWIAPVRPEDRIRIVAEVLSTRLSASKTDRGILSTKLDAHNDAGILVMTFQAVNFMLRRP